MTNLLQRELGNISRQNQDLLCCCKNHLITILIGSGKLTPPIKPSSVNFCNPLLTAITTRTKSSKYHGLSV
jgi:hypothetical protein